MRYITVMFSEEICLVARPEIKSLTDLAGKKVSINAKGTAAAVSIPVIFARLGIKADLQYADTNIALEGMRSGEFAAHTFLLAKPARAVAELKGEGLHILPIPFSNELGDLYLPSKFTNADYPNLIPAGREVETVAVGNILAVFNWPEGSDRYKKVARFTDAFFGRFAELQKQLPLSPLPSTRRLAPRRRASPPLSRPWAKSIFRRRPGRPGCRRRRGPA